jgi:hypothetical protein
MAGPLLRIADSAVRRCPLIEIASAPALHRPSTSSARSSSRTAWVGSPLGASSTVARTPGPDTGTKPVLVSSRRIRATVLCAELLAWPSRSWRPTLRWRSSTISSWSRDTLARSAVICRTRVVRLASLTVALREVCTAAIVTRRPKTAITTAAVRCDLPRGVRGACGVRRSATWR